MGVHIYIFTHIVYIALCGAAQIIIMQFRKENISMSCNEPRDAICTRGGLEPKAKL